MDTLRCQLIWNIVISYLEIEQIGGNAIVNMETDSPARFEYALLQSYQPILKLSSKITCSKFYVSILAITIKTGNVIFMIR